jgi:hypothetical protein
LLKLEVHLIFQLASEWVHFV